MHEKCSSVRVKLKNRESILKHLNAFLSQVAVSSEMRDSLRSGTINEEFVINLKELNRKIAFVESNEDVGVGMTRAAHNVAPQLEDLRSHAVRHVRMASIYICVKYVTSTNSYFEHTHTDTPVSQSQHSTIKKK